MTAIQASLELPAAGRVDGGGDGQLLLPRAPAAGAARARALARAEHVGYNLAVAALFALSASAVFTLAGTLWAAALARGVRRRRAGRRRAGAVALCLVLGNLAGAREWLHADSPPGGYDWFGVSRVIPDTINEFPSFSFTLGDLHAHVLAIPFTLLALAFALQVALDGPRGDLAWRAVAEALAAGLAVGALYAINSWSYPVAAGLLVGAVVVWMRGPARPGGAVRRGLDRARAARRLRARAAVLARLRPGRARDRLRQRAPLVRALGGRHGADLRRARLGRAGRLRRAAAGRAPAARADRGLGRRRRRVRALAAGAGRPRRGRGAAGRARRRPARGADARLGGARALPLAARRRRGRVRARARARLRPRRVRRQRPVPHEHGLQARLPGVPAARDRRRLRAPVGRPLAAPPRLGGWAAVGAVLLLLGLVFPYAGNWARRDGFSRSPTLDGLGWLRASAPATSRRSPGCARTRPTTPSCSRPPAPTTRASATRGCRPSPAARR